MNAFEFVDEVPASRQGHALKSFKGPDPVLVEFADALRNNPNQWAKYPKDLKPNSVGTTAWHINHRGGGACEALRTGEFEATRRNCVLYVRFVGAT